MEPEGSLLCSQQPTTGPYTESDASNPHILTLSIPVLFFCLHLGFPSGHFSSGFPLNSLCMSSSTFPYTKY